MLVAFSKEAGYAVQTRLETLALYCDHAVTVGQGIIDEKINTLHLSKTTRPHYEKAAQEVINYYLKPYNKLKKELESEEQ